jgi:hypothetical protein
MHDRTTRITPMHQNNHINYRAAAWVEQQDTLGSRAAVSFVGAGSVLVSQTVLTTPVPVDRGFTLFSVMRFNPLYSATVFRAGVCG